VGKRGKGGGINELVFRRHFAAKKEHRERAIMSLSSMSLSNDEKWDHI
jgi:hypothetical protein